MDLFFFFFCQTCWGSDQCSTRLHLYHRSITGCSTRFCRIQSCPGKLPHKHLSRCTFKLTLLFATCFLGSYPWESSVNETLSSCQYSSYFSLTFLRENSLCLFREIPLWSILKMKGLKIQTNFERNGFKCLSERVQY